MNKLAELMYNKALELIKGENVQDKEAEQITREVFEKTLGNVDENETLTIITEMFVNKLRNIMKNEFNDLLNKTVVGIVHKVTSTSILLEIPELSDKKQILLRLYFIKEITEESLEEIKRLKEKLILIKYKVKNNLMYVDEIKIKRTDANTTDINVDIDTIM